MNIASTDLIQDLIERTRVNMNKVESVSGLSEKTLNHKPSPESWSVLECLDHLIRYGNFYIPEMQKRIASSKYRKANLFKSGWLGDYFAKSMLPKEKLNKMKTFKSMNPSGSHLDKAVINEFLSQQHQLLELLDKARNVDISKTKTSISISKFIKLKLGDTFRVVIYHNQRHMVQIDNVLSHV